MAGQDLEDMVELLRRNEGVRTRLKAVGIWAGEDTSTERPNVQGVPWVGTIRDIEEAIQIHKLDEVVFSGRDVRIDTIVEALPMLGNRRVKCRIAWTDVGNVMSSGGAAREPFVAFQRGLHLPEVARTKRTFDVVFSVVMIVSSPVLIVARKVGWITMAWKVLIGQCTWVSPGNLKTVKPHLFEHFRLAGQGCDRGFTHAQDYHWRRPAVVVDALISHGAIISAAIIDILLPKMGESCRSHHHQIGGIGSSVEADDPIVEQDKVDSEVPAPEDGTLVEWWRRGMSFRWVRSLHDTMWGVRASTSRDWT